jgi:hypothetical protein
MRYTAFGLGVAAAVLELTGAIIGLGVAGVGFVFGGGGVLPLTIGVGMAMSLAVATLFCSVPIMFVRDPRPLGLVIAVAGVGSAVAGGPFVMFGAGLALVSGWLTFRIDRTAALI